MLKSNGIVSVRTIGIYVIDHEMADNKKALAFARAFLLNDSTNINEHPDVGLALELLVPAAVAVVPELLA